MDLQEQINILLNRLIDSENEIYTLKARFAAHMYQITQDKLSEDEQPIIEDANNILIGKVEEIYYIKEYEYKDTVFEQFLVTLNDNKKYYVDRFKGSKPKIEDGHKISYEIDGNKLRNVRVLTEIKSTNQNESRAERAAIAFKKRQEKLNEPK